MLLQICERLVCGVGPKVIEGCRNHVANLPPRQCRVATLHERRKGDPEKTRFYSSERGLLRTINTLSLHFFSW
jgi:hypothetical protein